MASTVARTISSSRPGDDGRREAGSHRGDAVYDDAGGGKRRRWQRDRRSRSRRKLRRQVRPGSTAGYSPRTPRSAVAASAERSTKPWTGGSTISSNRIWPGSKGQRVIFARDLLDYAPSARSRRDCGEPIGRHGTCASPVRRGDHVSGVYRQRVTWSSGRFAMIDDGVSARPLAAGARAEVGATPVGNHKAGAWRRLDFGRKRDLGI